MKFIFSSIHPNYHLSKSIKNGDLSITRKCQIEKNLFFKGIMLSVFFLNFIYEMLKNKTIKKITFRNITTNFQHLHRLQQMISQCGYKIYMLYICKVSALNNSDEHQFSKIIFYISKIKDIKHDRLLIDFERCCLNTEFVDYVLELLKTTFNYCWCFKKCKISYHVFRKILYYTSENVTSKTGINADYTFDELDVIDETDSENDGVDYHNLVRNVSLNSHKNSSLKIMKLLKNSVIEQLNFQFNSDNRKLFYYIMESKITVRKIMISSDYCGVNYNYYNDLIQGLISFIIKCGAFDELSLPYLRLNNLSHQLLSELVGISQLKSLKIEYFIIFEDDKEEYNKILLDKIIEIINCCDKLTNLILPRYICIDHRVGDYIEDSLESCKFDYPKIMDALENNYSITDFGTSFSSVFSTAYPGLSTEFTNRILQILDRNKELSHKKRFVDTKPIIED